MKKFATILLVSALCAGSAYGNVLFTEGFDYPDGSLTTVGAPNWVTHGGGAGQIQVSSGSIQLSTLATEDVNRSFGTTITSGSVYASFQFSVTASAPATGGDYEYFIHFGDGGTSNFNTRTDIVAPNGVGDYTLGLSSNSGTAQVVWASDLTYGVTYLGVIGYNRDTGSSTLWIDPTSEGSTSISPSGSTSFLDIPALYLRQSASSVGETITLDNIVVGTTFADVVVPEPSTYALLLGALGLGFVLVRRRKV